MHCKITIRLFIFIKVNINQINPFGKEKTLNYLDRTGNSCTLDWELLITQNKMLNFESLTFFRYY